LDPQAKHFFERALCCKKQCTNHNTIQLCKKEHIVPKGTRKLETHDTQSKSKLTFLPNYPGSQELSIFYVLTLELTATLIQFTSNTQLLPDWFRRVTSADEVLGL
jgi:hypothetical protein